MSKRKRQLICIALGVLVGALCLALGQISAFKTLERQTLDYRFRLRPKGFPDSPVVLVLIDDATLKHFGRSMLDDEDYEILAERLIALGAKSIAFDTFFMERMFPRMIDPLPSGRDRIIYPGRFILSDDETEIRASHIIAPYTLRDNLLLGHTNLLPDADGVLRRVKPFIDFEGIFYPFLPLLAVSDYLGIDTKRIDLSAACDAEGNLLLNYYHGRGGLKEISASKILEIDGPGREDYKGKIVFVGRSLPSFPDTISTPMQDDYPIIKVYATSVANLIHRDFLIYPSGLVLAIIILFLGGSTGYIVGTFRHLPAFILFLILFWLYLGLVYLAFTSMNLVLEVIVPGLVIIFGYLFTTILHYSVEERQLASSLARTSLYHRSVVESMPSGLIVIDTEGKVITLNERAEVLLGIKEARGLPYQDLLGEGRFREIIEEANLEWRNTKEEEITFKGRRLVTSGSVLKDEAGEAIGAMVIFQDVSEIRELQERIKLKERLAAIGELAAGVAHEFRNPLGSIASSAKLLANQLGSKNEYLDLIFKEAGVLGSLIEEFLYFSRPVKLNLTTVDLNGLLEDTLSFLLKDLDKTGIILEKDLGEIPLLEIDPSQMKRAFTNLIQNSLEAMRDVGRLKVQSARCRVEDNEFIQVSIEDTGPGIKEEDLPKIFDPFFTTRPEGTGLGLAIVHKIIEHHKGQIVCQSRVGEGTTFSIYLPVSVQK